MKSTGIIRRVDDLGRVVIPKEIRRTLKIREGDPLELFMEAGSVIFKKYSPMNEFSHEVKPIVEVLSKNLKKPIIVTDRDISICCYDISQTATLMKKCSEFMDDTMSSRYTYVKKNNDKSNITLKKCLEDCVVSRNVLMIKPIITSGEVCGSIILLSEEDCAPTEHEVESVEMMANLIAKIADNC